jgi:hypothetical protein
MVYFNFVEIFDEPGSVVLPSLSFDNERNSYTPLSILKTYHNSDCSEPSH